MIGKILLWIVFFAFGILAFVTEQNHGTFVVNGFLEEGKYVVWFVFICFLLYTIYCSWRENIIHSIRKMLKLHWARQIGIDLYLGLAVSLFFIYLNEGSIWMVLFWLVPTILYANLAILFYLAIHYEMIVNRFLSSILN
ncbi:hypothetical protein A0128_20185 [Leptospira tipperaryensis]|uniref:Uncharacterized protein n=1 Tax=Leptospira tipperaryensis TaxID=2564040 RepID=A0A1D7V3C8_9LEPT|nr:hypothetical protein [Leptospira tipperaryensis]AOP36340.1 hypothetical protein A0128_20185 [Leptospira tipperaryensis]